MPTDTPKVAGHGSCCKGDCTEQDAWRDWPPRSSYLRYRAEAQFKRPSTRVTGGRIPLRRSPPFPFIIVVPHWGSSAVGGGQGQEEETGEEQRAGYWGRKE